MTSVAERPPAETSAAPPERVPSGHRGVGAALQPTLAAYLPALLAEDGLVVVETDKRTEPQLPLEQRTSRTYGSARLTLFE